MKKSVFISGATGVMGKESLDAVLERGDCKVRLLIRPSKRNYRKMKSYLKRDDVEIVWGDLLDKNSVSEAVGDAKIILHMGGMVSPMADRFPEKTLKVNIEGTANLLDAVLNRSDRDDIKFVYIGSVAQMSNRKAPYHWGRTGDPLMASEFDYYGVSKIKAERLVAESGLARWVSLRQSGILHPGLFLRGSHPITFHVPLRGVLEWTTLEDSGSLMAALCGDDVPEEFWNAFYNIGSGADYRLTNYEFEQKLLKAIGSPAPEKIFEPNWFATRNFHGCWFADSDRLEELVPFRKNIPVDSYFSQMVKKAPWWVKMAPLAPAFVVKAMMKKVAFTPGEGTLDWMRRNDCEDKIKAFFGSREERENIPGWSNIELTRPSEVPVLIDHGYDETKQESDLQKEDFSRAAAFRGGKLLSDSVAPGNLDQTLEWECAYGHSFKASPRTILKGGHWCPQCLPAPWKYDEEVEVNPFISQVL